MSMRRPTSTMAEQIVINSKCQRMGVCNAAESLLVHADVAGEFLPAIGRELGSAAASKFAATNARASSFPQAKPATEDDYAAEFLGPIISSRVVGSVGRSHRAHQPLRFEAHRRDRDDRRRRRPRSLPRASIARP